MLLGGDTTGMGFEPPIVGQLCPSIHFLAEPKAEKPHQSWWNPISGGYVGMAHALVMP